MHASHLHSSPSLAHRREQTHTHTNTHKFWKGRHVCLGKVELDVKFAYAVSLSVVQCGGGGMLAPMLLHLYDKEVRANFCCLILQLIANRMSNALQHTATCRQPEHSMRLCKHKHHSLPMVCLNGQNTDEEMSKEWLFSELRINYFTYNISSFLTLFTRGFGIPYAEPAARVHSLEVAVWRSKGKVSMQMFSQVLLHLWNKKPEKKQLTNKKIKKINKSKPQDHVSTFGSYARVRACVACARMCVVTYFSNQAQKVQGGASHCQNLPTKLKKNLKKKLNKILEEWMLKAKMVQKGMLRLKCRQAQMRRVMNCGTNKCSILSLFSFTIYQTY